MSNTTNQLNQFCIFYQNCRGIRTKLHTLYMNILSNNYDVIVLTETWLISEIDNNEFIDRRYVVYRCDRDRTATSKKDGGGVLIAVLRGLRPALFNASVSVDSMLPKHIEHIMVEIPSAKKHKKHIISAAYIPPRSPSDVYEKHFDLLLDYIVDSGVDNFYIIGDYNTPDITWEPSLCDNSDSHSSPHLSSIGSHCVRSILSSFLGTLNATQYNNISNVNGNILDLFISNVPSTIRIAADPLLPADPHHPPLVALTGMYQTITPMNRRPLSKHNFRKADFNAINLKIEDTNWTELLSPLSSDACLDKFYNVLDDIIKQHTPLSGTRTAGFPVWFSCSLIKTFRKKRKAWIRWKKFGNQVDYENFSYYRALFKQRCKQSFDKYITSVEDNITKNIKHFWTYISNLKAKSEIPHTMHYLKQKSDDPETICNMFSDFFLSVFEPASPSLQQWQPPSITSDHDILISSMHFSETQIIGELKKLDTSKGPGPDGLPPLFFKLTADTICKPLYIIYNKCMAEGVFPKVWKHANITPVHKNGSKHNVEQYRPISILSALSKLFERLVHNQIYPILHKTIIEEQHGFVKNRSTTSNLLTFTNALFENIDDRVQIDAIYTDFEKAFDKVDHEILLNKIAYNGIRGNLLRWFASYVLNRTQKVVVNGYQSASISVTSGVPQGSILGPLLFVIFINDIKECFQNSKFLLYADDLKVYKIIKNMQDCESLQSDLDRFTAYCTENKLHLSVQKCYSITFTKKKRIVRHNYYLSNSILTTVSDLRDLGIQLDSKLHLNLHIDKIISKAYRMYGFVMRSATDFKRPSTYLYLYKTLIRSQLEYAVPIWNPHYKKYKEAIEKVQSKFLRSMHYRCFKRYLSRDPLLSKYKVTTLEVRRRYLEAMTLYKIVNNKFDCTHLVSSIHYAVPRNAQRRAARSSRLFAVGTCRTNAGLRAPIRRMMRCYDDNLNENSIDLFSSKLCNFKKSVIAKLLS
ncbi:hypothetical protein ABMA27_005236 [Loxostege sticticalis]|uniref:Reverse transcriptase domain-containing protein n=1 Tax=Loxostege sticticalis TaxID=481309 RepID=A0ABR3HM76_LOXSC